MPPAEAFPRRVRIQFPRANGSWHHANVLAPRSNKVVPRGVIQAIKIALEKDGGALLASAIQSRDVDFFNRVVNSVDDAVR